MRETGAMKPDPRVFKFALGRLAPLGVQQADILHVAQVGLEICLRLCCFCISSFQSAIALHGLSSIHWSHRQPTHSATHSVARAGTMA